jgi:hypothetical protein
MDYEALFGPVVTEAQSGLTDGLAVFLPFFAILVAITLVLRFGKKFGIKS